MKKEINNILYSGIYPPTAPRDRVYLAELKRRGFLFSECVDTSAGIRKYVRLFSRIRAAARGADLVWVGYLSSFVVPLVYLATRKPILYNALGSSYEAYVLDRAAHTPYSPRALLFWVADFLSFHLADIVLVESESQKRYLAKQFLVSSVRLQVVFTGVDEGIFHPDPSVTKAEVFTVAFRGMFIPATGVEVVLEAAKLLQNEPIRFWISGWGELQDKVLRYIVTNKLKNVELNTVFLEPDLLRRKLLSAHVLLGQFSANARLDRTIQHKTAEALALGQPFITRDSESNREVLTDGVHCLFVRAASPRDVADKILRLRADSVLRENIGKGALRAYKEKLLPRALGDRIERALKAIMR